MRWIFYLAVTVACWNFGGMFALFALIFGAFVALAYVRDWR